MNLKIVRQVVEILNRSAVSEISVQYGDTKITARRGEPVLQENHASQAPSAPPTASEPTPASDEPETVTVTANRVGIFHRRLPGKRALVEVGSEVEANQPIAFIESVKLRNEVMAPTAGTVVEILPSEGQPVQYGDPLIVIRPRPSGATGRESE